MPSPRGLPRTQLRGFISLGFIILLIVGLIAFAGAGWYVYHRHLVDNGPSSHDVCSLSSCWGAGGCNYLVCGRPDGSRYDQYVAGDRPFSPEDYVQKIELP